MNRFFVFLVTIYSAFLLMPGSVAYAKEEYSFRHIHITSDRVHSLCSDHSGRIWVATSRGVFRYGDFIDEINFEIRPEQLQKNLSSISRFCDGKLIATEKGNYPIVFDPETNSIINDVDSLVRSYGVSFDSIWDCRFYNDAAGRTWISNGVSLYCKEMGQTVRLMQAAPEGKIINVAISTYEYCVMTDSYFYIYPINGDSSTPPVVISHGFTENLDLLNIALDNDGNIWAGYYQLYRIDRQTGKANCLIKNLSVMQLSLGRSGKIMVASGSAGVYIFNSDGKMVKHLEHEPHNKYSLVSNNVRSIFEDTDGTLWVCHDKQVVSVSMPDAGILLNKHILPLYENDLEENIKSIAQGSDGTVWFGTDGMNLFCQDPDGSFRIPDVPLKDNSVISICPDSRDRIWIGTYRAGIYCKENNTVRRILPEISCSRIIEDSEGNIWAAAQRNGLYKFPAESRNNIPQAIDSIDGRWVLNIAEKDGTIFVGTTGGLYEVAPGSLKAVPLYGTKSGRQKFANNHFQCLLADSRDMLWLISNREDSPLEIYDLQRDTIMCLPQLSGRLMQSILEDSNRNIWITSGKDLICVIPNYDVGKQSYSLFPHIYRNNNLNDKPNYYNLQAAARLSDGTLLFGCTSGYQRINPQLLPPYSNIPGFDKIYLSSLMVNNSFISVGGEYDGRVILPRDLSVTESIKLRHKENNISLVLYSKDYSQPFNNEVYYRVRNKENEWMPVRNKTIELMHLFPGHYDLEIGCKNPGGIISGNLAGISIVIKFPWYSSWWAITIYVLLSLAGAYQILKYRENEQRSRMHIQKLQMESERQEQLNDMKFKFFTNISHDLRTPLSMIITPLEYCMGEKNYNLGEKTINIMHRNAVSLLNMVNQILDIRKLEKDSMTINLSYGNLVSFVKDICSSFLSVSDAGNCNLKFKSSEDGILMYFDKDKVTKIVMNLLSNAIKFSDEGGDIDIIVERRGEEAVIVVKDCGAGIPDEEKEKIFQRFYQLKDNVSSHTGTGIGLNIVSEFVKLHNGRVTVSDNEPRGTVFSIFLPVREQEAEGLANAREDEKYQAGDGDRLLLVEDNRDFLEFMKDQLSDQFKVFTARDGNSALHVLENNDVDIILSDIMMEGMDGIELCRIVKNDLATSHIPFVLLTAKTMAEDELHALEIGADDYLTKPFNMQVLRQRINKLIENNRQMQQKFKDKIDVSPSEITITTLDEQFLARAIKITEDNMSDPDFSVETLSDMLGVHRTNLYKKMISLTGKTPKEFIRVMRMKRSAQYLSGSQKYVSEIAYLVGFNSPKLFAKYFREEFGMSPREYQNRSGDE